MKLIWDVTDTANWIVTICCIVLFALLTLFVLFKTVRRKAAYIFVMSGFAILLVSYILNLQVVLLCSAGLIIVASITTFIVNIGDLRKFLANPFKRATPKVTQYKVEKIFDRKELYSIIEKTVLSLSDSKTGAIMSFEKNTPLKDISLNGVAVNAPVTKEMLETIFYPGTRLHDGAVIIKGNMIVSAAVFFTPTTKAFATKYGSRHRAAIGISEIADCITVVVSEETGRISIAANGQIESIDRGSFLRVFENYMA